MNGTLRSSAARGMGFSLLEVTAAVAFVGVSLLGLSTLILSNKYAATQAREQSIVTHYLRYMSEKIRAARYGEIAMAYQGYKFTIDELGDVEGTVQVFVDEKDSSPAAQEFGLPRDLDGDGLVSEIDVSESYVLLPIRITLTRRSDPSFFRVHRFLLSPEE